LEKALDLRVRNDSSNLFSSMHYFYDMWFFESHFLIYNYSTFQGKTGDQMREHINMRIHIFVNCRIPWKYFIMQKMQKASRKWLCVAICHSIPF
jgi:hypothetical protein